MTDKENMDMEYLDIVTEDGNPTGEQIERSIAHRDGIMHRTAHVWIVRPKEGGFDVLLQKRSQNKESFPGMYDTSSAGHIPAGDEPLDSALRELQEELGIKAVPEQLHFAGKFRIQYEKEFHGKMFKDNEVTTVYVYMDPVNDNDLILQESEVEDVRWFDFHEVIGEIKTSRERFCVPSEGIGIVDRYLNNKL